MQIDNEFRVQAPAGDVWAYLQRTDDVVDCIPGAAILAQVSEDEYLGQVTVKLGPLAVVLKGTVTIDERDHEARRMKITGRAKDTKGRGATDAGVVVQVAAEGDATRVALESDIKITGKIAQFGRGVMKDVSQRIADEFARNLEARLTDPAVPDGTPDVVADQRAGVVTGAASDDAPGASSAGPRLAPSASAHRAPSVGGIRLVLGALGRALASAVGAFFRRLAKPFAGQKAGR
jgi:carbon monoxide dehydrogenase subunit G